MDINKIIKKEELKERFINISYVNKRKEKIDVKIDTENKDKKIVLQEFSEQVEDFLGFFHPQLQKVEPEVVKSQFVMHFANQLFKYNNSFYLLDKI